MDREDIEKLIDKRIDNKISAEVSKAKLEISESRLRFALWFGAALFTIAGVIIPIWITGTSSTRVDRAIEEMEERFEKLAGTQLREPDLQCFIDGQTLEGNVLTIDIQSKEWPLIRVQNSGTAPAEKINLRLLVDKDGFRYSSIRAGELYGINIWWQPLEYIDEEGFIKAYDMEYEHKLLNAKDSFIFDLKVQKEKPKQKFEKVQIRALLKIFYYRTPEPKKIPFTIVVVKSKEKSD